MQRSFRPSWVGDPRPDLDRLRPDEIACIGKLSLSQVRAVFRLSVAGWLDRELTRVYGIPAAEVRQLIDAQHEEVIARHATGEGPAAIASILGLMTVEVQKLTAGIAGESHRECPAPAPTDEEEDAVLWTTTQEP
jgi:hypothetical protein